MSEMFGPTKEEFLAQQLRVVANAAPQTINRHQTKKVRPRHKMVVMLHEAGWKNDEIAKALGYTPSRVSIIINSNHPELQKARAETASRVADNIDDTYNRIKLYANEMLDVMVTHARNLAEPANSRMAARDILHMAGYSPIKRQYNVDVQVPAEEVINAAKRIQDANEVAANYQIWSVDKKEDKP